MFVKILMTFSIFGLMGILTACTDQPATAEIVIPSPSEVPGISFTPEIIAGTPTSISSISSDCRDMQEVPVEECQALVAIFKSTNGESWEDHSGWLVSQTPCSWYGVICEQGHVVELQLYYNQLAGPLPAEIGSLAHLKHLYLDRNQLSGPVPVEIGNLAQLETARLGGNQLSGSIPAEMANLKRLMYLELWGNQLSGEIPGKLGNLSQLLELRLHSNQFTGSIPSELGNLSNLTHLDLSKNQLGDPIPSALGTLPILNELNLSANQLSGSIPAEWDSLKNLYSFDLSYNQLTGDVPAAITNALIGDLRLWGNLLEGTVPASKEEMTAVEYEGVHFEFPSALAESVWPEIVVEQPPSDQMAFWIVGPEHSRFTFASRSVVPFQTNGMGISGYPQIVIYPAREYGTMSEPAKAEIDGLQSLMTTRPSVPKDKLPFLPLINAAQTFHAQEKYIDFQNGSGIRYLTQYSQDITPITNQNIFYTFQGLTADGAYYVTATFPISAPTLADEPAIDDWNAFGAGYQDYLTQTINDLNALGSDDYEPDLALLDTMIQSLRVDTP